MVDRRIWVMAWHTITTATAIIMALLITTAGIYVYGLSVNLVYRTTASGVHVAPSNGPGVEPRTLNYSSMAIIKAPPKRPEQRQRTSGGRRWGGGCPGLGRDR